MIGSCGLNHRHSVNLKEMLSEKILFEEKWFFWGDFFFARGWKSGCQRRILDQLWYIEAFFHGLRHFFSLNHIASPRHFYEAWLVSGIEWVAWLLDRYCELFSFKTFELITQRVSKLTKITREWSRIFWWAILAWHALLLKFYASQQVYNSKKWSTAVTFVWLMCVCLFVVRQLCESICQKIHTF